jgi:hypothetical protein
MESQAFDALMKQLPEGVKLALVVFVLLVLFYPRLVAFFGHISPQERAIRKAKRRREMEELGLPVEEALQQSTATATATEAPSPTDGLSVRSTTAPDDASPGQGYGASARLARLRNPQVSWCFTGAFITNVALSSLSYLPAARHFSETQDSYLPYVSILPSVLIFGSVFAFGLAALGIMFFGQRGRWGSVLLGFGMALAFWMLQLASNRLMVGAYW